MKIYTRTGDAGTTALFGGTRLRKDALRIEAYGTVDEMNACIGVARASDPDAETDGMLAHVQNTLFILGSDLATPPDTPNASVPRIGDEDVAWLERAIDEMEDRLPPIRVFILPGGSPIGAHLHHCRTVCRRAERRVVALATVETITESTLRYLNRLSDFLFVAARYANMRAGGTEAAWKSPGSR